MEVGRPKGGKDGSGRTKKTKIKLKKKVKEKGPY